MKTQVIVSGTLAASLGLAVAIGGMSGCSSDPVDIGGKGGGGSDSVSQAASTTGGTGGSMPDAGPNPLTEPCKSVCDHLKAIDCTAWPNCSTECVSGFNAPLACQDEVKALIDCWVTNQADFTCSMTQLIPPPACQELEAKFNECFSGMGSTGSGNMLCQGQTKNGSENTCSAKTECPDGVTIYKSTCAIQGSSMDWTCSCYKGDKLLGTCTDTKNICDNHMGCCTPFFYLSQQ